MKYVLIDRIEGRFTATELTADNVIPALEVRGYAYTGENRNGHQRWELQGLPRFRGLNGPMWGGQCEGEIIARYETPAAYRYLSE